MEWDNYEIRKTEEEEKEIYLSEYRRNSKIARRTLLAVFCSVGMALVLLSLVFFLMKVKDEEDGIELWIVFLPMAILFIVLGIILFFAIPKEGNYEKFKKYMDKPSYFQANGKTFYLFLRKKIEHLELENEDLRKRVEELERKVRRKDYE